MVSERLFISSLRGLPFGRRRAYAARDQPRSLRVTRFCLCLVACLPLLAACSSRPDVAARESAAAQAAPWPQLAPLPVLLAGADAPSVARPAEAEVAGRAARLRARAASLRAAGG
jgi:hypothetical protein